MASIINKGTNCWDVAAAEQTGLLIDARNYYRAFYTAAREARQYILICGWQFDSDVKLVRGEDAADGDEAALLSFLNGLCEKNENLRVYILAWNFNAIYGIDREWFQKWYFNWTTNERLTFCFDDCHCLGASHHQKFAVIDGAIAFLGGLDLCRAAGMTVIIAPTILKGRCGSESVPPAFHDVQSYQVGAVAEKLAELFKQRWKLACCTDLTLAAPPVKKNPINFAGSFPIQSSDVAISRTQTKTDDGRQDSHQEIRRFLSPLSKAPESGFYLRINTSVRKLSFERWRSE